MTAVGKLDQLHQDLCRLVLEKHHQSTMATRHIAVATWLEALGMLDYLECFANYNGVEEILNLSEGEIRDLGLRNPAHRAKIVSSLRILREKYERSATPGKKTQGQHSLPRNQNVTAQLSWSPPSLLNSPDYQAVGLSPERLQQDLIVELQGDPADLKSRAWYHATVPRQRAESLVSRNGDFLVRDCISKPGDFVLTCCWKGGPLHFVINSTVADQGPNELPRVTYHFEDLQFSSVQELIQFYMEECKQITEISGAVITTPVARSMPLSYYDSKYGTLSQYASGAQYAPVGQPGTMIPGSPQTNVNPGVGQMMAGSPVTNNPSVGQMMAGSPVTNQNVNQMYAGSPVTNPSVNQMYAGMMTPPGVSPRNSPRNSPHSTPAGSPSRGTPAGSPSRGSPSGSPHSLRRGKVERSGSQPLLSVNNIPIGATSIDRSGSMPVIPGMMNRQVTPTREYMPEFASSPSAIAPGLEADSGIYKQARPPQSSAHAPGNAPAPAQTRPPVYIHQRSGSAPVLTPGVTVTQHFDYLAPPRNLTPASSDSDLHKAPPPKPSRIPSVKYKKKPQVVIRNVDLYKDDERDYSDYNQVTSEPSWLKNESANQRLANTSETANQGQPYNQNMQNSLYDNNLRKGTNHLISNQPTHDVNQNIPQKDSRKISDTNFSLLDGHDYSDIPAFPLELNLKKTPPNTSVPVEPKPVPKSNIKIPEIKNDPSYDLEAFASMLLPGENRLLEPSTLLKMRQAILMTDAGTLARHLTAIDLEVLNVVEEEDLGVRVTSGLELLTLPQGSQLRQDLVERMFCLKAFVMVMILTCPKVVDRAAVLSKWIAVAMETHVAVGNLFGFENIMAGLMSDQILRLRDTWMVLRQNHTNSAFVFDTKLKSAYRTLADGSGTLPVQDISVPSIAPIITLLQYTLDSGGNQPHDISDINNDLDIMLIHLDMARVITAQCGMYRVVGKARLQNLEQEGEKLEMFRTEFHLRFLWGSKAAGANRTERHNKFTMLLKAYSEKLELDDDDGTAV